MAANFCCSTGEQRHGDTARRRAQHVAEHPDKETLREQWMMATDRWAARAGWNLTASRVNKDPRDLDLSGLLDRIEQEMPEAMPEVQWTMNNTLGAIGIHHPKHRKRAIAIGEKILIKKSSSTCAGYSNVTPAGLTRRLELVDLCSLVNHLAHI